MCHIRLVKSPTERTTAATDVLIAALAVGVVVFLSQMTTIDVRKTLLWIFIYAMLGLAAALGAMSHGLVLPRNLDKILWAMLYLLIGQVIALFTAGAIYDVWGWRVAQAAFPVLAMVGLSFLGVTAFWGAGFAVFIGYQALAMFFALGGYLWLALAETLPGAWWMAAGILVTIVASVFQARENARLVIIWEFDHNGVYHLVQVVGLVLLVIGLWLGLTGD